MKTNNNNTNVMLAPGIYWVGSHTRHKGLGCNPYLIIDGDEGVLFDPGSVLDFEIVFKNVESLISLEKIKTIVLHHQDPDLCSSLPLWEKAGFKGQLALHWRTSLIVQYYGIKSRYYMVNENQYRLELKGGRVLRFIGAPYLHFPGAIMTYDETSGILFSGDVFGAMGDREALFADDKYPELMKAFHEHYMPSRDILKSTMDKLMPLSINTIAPQHGSIINEAVKDYIRILSNLECGSLMSGERKDLVGDGGYVFLCNQLIKRINALFPEPDWIDIFEGTLIDYDADNLVIRDFNYEGSQLWDLFFSRVYLKRGPSWLSSVEPMVNQLVQTYNIEYPAIYQSRFTELEIDKAELDAEAKSLQVLRNRLENQAAEARQKMMTCPLTGFNNERYFRFFGIEEFSPSREAPPSSFFIFVTLDRLAQINLEQGSEEGDRNLVSLAYLLENNLRKQENIRVNHVFKLNGPRFLYYLGEADLDKAYQTAEDLRLEVSESDLFLKPVTISQGLVKATDIFNPDISATDMIDKLLQIGEIFLRKAQSEGMNAIITNASMGEDFEREGKKVLIIDPDEYYTSLIARELEFRGFRVISCSQGEAGLSYIQENRPDLVISEVSVPMLSGLELRARVMGDPQLRGIPFLLVSHRRDDELIQQAHRLQIVHYLAKPVSLTELLGLVEILLEIGQ